MERLAIVVATLERPASVARLVPQILEQAPATTEIRIVDQSSGPARAQLAGALRAHDDARLAHVIHGPPGLPAARNRGLAETTAPLVLFLDDDVELLPGCVAAHLAAYRDPTVGGVVGRILERRLRPNAWTTTNRVAASGRIRTRLDGPDGCDIETLKGANMSLRRASVEAVGGFDEAFGGTALLEDADVSSRVRRFGFRLRYEPDAAVVHHHDPMGGVRTGQPDAVWWRFHNTARYVRRHHPVGSWPRFGLTFGGLAVWEALRTGRPGRTVELLRALVEGSAGAQPHCGKRATSGRAVAGRDG